MLNPYIDRTAIDAERASHGLQPLSDDDWRRIYEAVGMVRSSLREIELGALVRFVAPLASPLMIVVGKPMDGQVMVSWWTEARGLENTVCNLFELQLVATAEEVRQAKERAENRVG